MAGVGGELFLVETDGVVVSDEADYVVPADHVEGERAGRVLSFVYLAHI